MNQAQSRVQFAQWLKDNHPALFARAIAIAENSTATLGALGAENGGFWSKFTTAAMGLGTTYLALKNQRDAMKLNLERAQTGLPPIDMATSAPVVRTEVDMSPELTQRLVSSVGGAMQTPLLLAAAAIAVFFLIRK